MFVAPRIIIDIGFQILSVTATSDLNTMIAGGYNPTGGLVFLNFDGYEWTQDTATYANFTQVSDIVLSKDEQTLFIT
jgi:hypothetical protein